MAAMSNYLVKYIVWVLFIVMAVKEAECCLPKDNSVDPRVVPAYSSYFQLCSCIIEDPNDKIHLEYLKWIDPNGLNIHEAGPGTHLNVYAEKSEDGINLLIQNFTTDLSGKYTCEASYKKRLYINTFQLNAFEPLHIVNTADKQFLVKGHDSKIVCEVRGGLNPMTIWHKQDNELTQVQITDNNKYSVDDNGLVIRNVQEEDAGIYECTSIVIITGDRDEKQITVEVFTTPDIRELVVTPNKTVVEGDFLKIECKAYGKPKPNFNWMKIVNKKPTQLSQDDASWYQENEVLTFEKIRADDRGTYRCIAFNEAGIHTREVTIEVLIPPKILEFNNATAEEGTKIELICRASGRPLPLISFLFERTGADEDSSITPQSKQISETEIINSLIFEKVDKYHHGLYLCRASNDVDVANQTAQLEVQFKPVFEEPEVAIWGWKGEIVNLTCPYESNPEATIRWNYYQNGGDFKFARKFPHTFFMLVDLKDIPFYGTYTCTVSNKIGQATRTIHLKEAHAPGSIKSVNIISTTATSTTFEIHGPDSVDGPPVTAYTAEYDELDNYYHTYIHYNRTWDTYRPYKVDKLKPSTTYAFKFAAMNQVGLGPWTDVIQVITKNKSPPEEPMWNDNASGEEIDVNNVIVSWKTPEFNGEPIDRYTIQYCEVDVDDDVSEQCYQESVSDNSISLQNLKPNTTYHLKLVAHNSIGDSGMAEKYIRTSGSTADEPLLTVSNIIGISVLLVVLCLILFDLILFCWKRQGVIASLRCKKKQRKHVIQESQATRDKKGLLRDGESPTDTTKPENNGHKEFVYQKNTGLITGKHSAV